MIRKLSAVIFAAGLGVSLPAASATVPPVQQPNPAAVFCASEGGTYEIVSDKDGQRGLCRFADGRVVDAWQFYRDSHRAAPAQIVNPAASHCLAAGGAYRVVRSADGERGLCKPQGGEEIDAWQYFRQAQGTNLVGLPNPAARFCINSGGTYRTERSAEGERGLCTPRGGTEMDAWEYFRQHQAGSGS
jgi:putative hemolysin